MSLFHLDPQVALPWEFIKPGTKVRLGHDYVVQGNCPEFAIGEKLLVIACHKKDDLMSGFAVIEITASQGSVFVGKNVNTGKVAKYSYTGILPNTEGKTLEYKPVADL